MMSDHKIVDSPEHPLLVIDTGEAKRTVESPTFDSQAYEADRLLFIEQGMVTVARRSYLNPQRG